MKYIRKLLYNPTSKIKIKDYHSMIDFNLAIERLKFCGDIWVNMPRCWLDTRYEYHFGYSNTLDGQNVIKDLIKSLNKSVGLRFIELFSFDNFDINFNEFSLPCDPADFLDYDLTHFTTNHSVVLYRCKKRHSETIKHHLNNNNILLSEILDRNNTNVYIYEYCDSQKEMTDIMLGGYYGI